MVALPDRMAARSARIEQTDPPCIVQMQRLLRGLPDLLSLAQGRTCAAGGPLPSPAMAHFCGARCVFPGIVHWSPPPVALEAAKAAVGERAVSQCVAASLGCLTAVPAAK